MLTFNFYTYLVLVENHSRRKVEMSNTTSTQVLIIVIRNP